MATKRRRLSKDADVGVDHLSDLHDDPLISILCLLPTQEAARTSILSRRFNNLWMKCPDVRFTLEEGRFIIQPGNKIVTVVLPMLFAVINNRDPAIPLQRLHLECNTTNSVEIEHILPLIVKAHSLGLRHLTLNLGPSFVRLRPILHTIFTLSSMESLSFPGELAYTRLYDRPILPSTVTLPRLKSLSLGRTFIDTSELNQLISGLNCLEHLHLQGHSSSAEPLSLSSQTIRHLSLEPFHQCGFKLNLPALEFLRLQCYCLCNHRPHFEARLPLLKKCIVSVDHLYKGHGNYVTELLSCLSYAEELKLVLTKHFVGRMPYRALIDSGKDFPVFGNLKHLEVTTAFHELNCKDTANLVCKAPALRSLKLTHTVVCWVPMKNKRVRKSWSSKLPCNSEGNYRYAYFTDLHLEDNREKVVRLLNKKLRK